MTTIGDSATVSWWLGIISLAACVVVSSCTGATDSSSNSAVSASGEPAISDDSNCDSPDVKTGAATTLADWLNAKVGKNNSFHVHGTFITEISTSVTIGTIQGTKQCIANVSIGLKWPGGDPLVAQAPVNMHFLLTDGRITFNDAELLTDQGAFDTAGTLLAEEAQREESRQVQPEVPTAKANPTPSSKPYTIAECMETWQPHCMMQEHPEFYDNAPDCNTALSGMARPDGPHIAVMPDGTSRLNGQSPVAWMQCYDTRK